MNSSAIDYLSLGIIKKDQVFVLFSCPEWQTFYLESQCFEFDPLVKSALLNVDVPIGWHSIVISRKKASFIMDTRKELTGCQEGFSVVKKIDEDTSALLAFGTRGSFSELVDAYFTYKHQLLELIKTINIKLT